MTLEMNKRGAVRWCLTNRTKAQDCGIRGRGRATSDKELELPFLDSAGAVTGARASMVAGAEAGERYAARAVEGNSDGQAEVDEEDRREARRDVEPHYGACKGMGTNLRDGGGGGQDVLQIVFEKSPALPKFRRHQVHQVIADVPSTYGCGRLGLIFLINARARFEYSSAEAPFAMWLFSWSSRADR